MSSLLSPFYSLLQPFYLVPAAVVVLVWWAVWQPLRLFNLSVIVRRAVFVALGTLGLAPVIAPATVTAVMVPHGSIFLLLDLNYYVRFSQIVIPSFTVTATVLGLVAWWRIRGEAKRERIRWVAIGLPVLVIVASAGLFRYTFPDRSIPEYVNAPAIESVYGELLDAVVALPVVEDIDERRLAGEALQGEFESDPAVLAVTYPISAGPARGEDFEYLRRERPPSYGCSSRPRPDQIGLMRCTWTYGALNRLDVLRYSRSPIGVESEGDDVAIEFFFDEVVTSLAK